MKSGDFAWLAMAVGITAYEFGAALTPRGELLSEAVDRYRGAKPIATYALIVYLAGHLARVWPRKMDPLTILTSAAGRMVAR